MPATWRNSLTQKWASDRTLFIRTTFLCNCRVFIKNQLKVWFDPNSCQKNSEAFWKSTHLFTAYVKCERLTQSLKKTRFLGACNLTKFLHSKVDIEYVSNAYCVDSFCSWILPRLYSFKKKAAEKQSQIRREKSVVRIGISFKTVFSRKNLLIPSYQEVDTQYVDL